MPASAVPAAPGGRPGGRGAPLAGAERRRLTATGARVPPSRRVEEVSAGGLVLERASRTARVVLIGRLDRRGRLLWSLPKGHVEAGETHQDTAIREVREETGITGRVLGPLGCIDFWFTADGRRVHKTVHHFLLLATGGELSDADVEVTEVAWVPLAQAPLRLAYPTERALVERVPFVLADTA